MPDSAMLPLNLIVDLFWVTIGTFLIILMQAGFACLESGITRSKNNINVAVKKLSNFTISVLLFWAVGFGLMFGTTRSGVIGIDKFLMDMGNNPHPYAGYTFLLFQSMFCATATTIISGGVAERLKFSAYLIMTVVMAAVIYPIFGHWAWAGSELSFGIFQSGWLHHLGFVDFAGSTVVHCSGGWVALAMLIVVGPRAGRFMEDGCVRKIPGSNLTLSVVGVLLIWIGWFGFNGASTLRFSEQVPLIIMNTVLSGAMAGVVASAITWYREKKPNVLALMNGTLAGLVGITANCHAVSPISAVMIGAGSGAMLLVVNALLLRYKIDDAVDVVPVHLGGGLWGTVAVVLFGKPELLGTGLDKWHQLGVQLLGASICGVWAFTVAYGVMRLLKHFYPLRVTDEEEQLGLNVVEHGESSEYANLLKVMDSHAKGHSHRIRADVDQFTEIGNVAAYYNNVMDKLNTINSELKVKRKEAEDATSSQRIFLANISHELRTPLNGIMGLSELLGDSYLTKDQSENVAAIHDSATALLALVNNLLDFSKIEAGEASMERTPFNLHKELEKVVDLLSPLAVKKGLKLELVYKDNLPRSYIGDSMKIKQIIINFIGNALKFTEKGEVLLTASLVSRNAARVVVLLEVKDSGPGISAAQQQYIFQRFTQVDSSITRKYGGTGLGLAISKMLAELLGGTLGILSDGKNGSTFWVQIPIEPAEIEEEEEESVKYSVSCADANQSDYSLSVADKRILVVEDQHINQMLLIKMLIRMGFVSITVADNGAAGLEQLKSHNFDLVFMDCQMPILDGYEVTRQYREWEDAHSGESYRKTPIIAMTAHSMASDRARCMSAGMSDYMNKPISQHRLYGMIAKWHCIAVTPKKQHAQCLALPDTAVQGGETVAIDDPVDLAYIRLFSDGDKAIEKELLAMFIASAKENFTLMRKNIEDREKWCYGAHTLKGNAANMGAIALSALFKKAEEEGKGFSVEKRLVLLEETEAEYNRVVAFMEAHCIENTL